MKQYKLNRIWSPLFDRYLAGNLRDHDEIKLLLQKLKQMALELQSTAMTAHDPQCNRTIEQKQLIVHRYRVKALSLLRECNQKRRNM